MIEKIYAYSKEKKILKKLAFLPSLTATTNLSRGFITFAFLKNNFFIP